MRLTLFSDFSFHVHSDSNISTVMFSRAYLRKYYFIYIILTLLVRNDIERYLPMNVGFLGKVEIKMLMFRCFDGSDEDFERIPY